MKLMVFIYLCVTSTLLVPNSLEDRSGQKKGWVFLTHATRGRHASHLFSLLDPNVFVIMSLSTLFELGLTFRFNFYAAPYASFQIVISGVSGCGERKLSLRQIAGLYLNNLMNGHYNCFSLFDLVLQKFYLAPFVQNFREARNFWTGNSLLLLSSSRSFAY